MNQTVSPGSAVDRVRLARVANGVSWIRMSGVARSSGSATVVLVAGKALSLIIVLGLAKTVPPADYGVFVFARNLVLILGPIATLGWGVAAVGFLPSYMATRRSELAKGFHLAAMGTTIATALVLTVALTAALALFPNLLEATFRPAVTIALTGLVGYALMTLNSETARALGLFSVAYVPNHLGHPLLLMGLLGALWIGSVPIDRVNAILVLVLSYSTVAALQLALILSSAPLSFRQAKPAWSVREWFGASAPLTLITASILIVELSPPVILGFFAPASTVWGVWSHCRPGPKPFDPELGALRSRRPTSHCSHCNEPPAGRRTYVARRPSPRGHRGPHRLGSARSDSRNGRPASASASRAAAGYAGNSYLRLPLHRIRWTGRYCADCLRSTP
jgi:hypothetical protein